MDEHSDPTDGERRLRAQFTATRALAEAASLDEAVPQVLEAVCEALRWDLGQLWMVDPGQQLLRYVAGWHRPVDRLAAFQSASSTTTFNRGAGLPGGIWERGEPIWIEDASSDPRVARAAEAQQEGLWAAFGAPVIRGTDVIGVLEFFGRKVRGPDPELLQMMKALARDLVQFVARREIEQLVVESEAMKTAIIESALDAVIMLDHTGAVVEFNPAAEATFGYRRTDVLGRNIADLVVPPELRERHLQGFRRCVETGQSKILGQRLEFPAMRADGSQFPAELTINRVDLPGPPMFAGYLRDVSERKRMDAEVAFLAYHDKLTGLPNRALFEELLEVAVARARRNEQAVAVLYMDVDNFKMVNDSLGHAAGDLLLQDIAQRLQHLCREGDVVARQGGDEFLLLVGDLGAHHAGVDGPAPIRRGPPEAASLLDALPAVYGVAERIKDALDEPFLMADTELFASVSTGISIFPLDAEDGRTLLKNADSAMYRSKKAGPGGYKVFPTETSDPRNRLSFVTRLRRAVENKDWELHYQPLCDLIRFDMVGVEALIRWRDPHLGLVMPNDFLPLAEELGFMEAIGNWLMEELFEQHAAWEADGLDLVMSFNLSPRQLWHPEFAEKLLRAVDLSGMNASNLVVEMTESAAMADPDRTLTVLTALRERGVRFAIDDFGTGYSSLSRLRDLPVDILKIDRSFVRDVPGDRHAETLVTAVVQLAHNLGMAALAEGIETEAQRVFMVEQGCLVGQGFYFSEPVPADQIPDLYQREETPSVVLPHPAARRRRVIARSRSASA